MMKIKILFNIMRKQILLFFVLSIFFSNAQPKWTLEECVIYALENNISIKQTENDPQHVMRNVFGLVIIGLAGLVGLA